MAKGRPYGEGKKYIQEYSELHTVSTKKKSQARGWATYIGSFEDGQYTGNGALMLCDDMGS
jgi:hypothetical protein